MGAEGCRRVAIGTGAATNRHGGRGADWCNELAICGIVTSGTGVMHLIVEDTCRNTRCVAGSCRMTGVAVGRINHSDGMVNVRVAGEICSMAAFTLTAHHIAHCGHGAREVCFSHRQQGTVRMVTRGAGIMNLVVGSVNRGAGGRAAGTGVAIDTSSRRHNPRGVIDVFMVIEVSTVTADTFTGHHVDD